MTGNHPEETVVVVVTGLDEIVESVRAVRRPVAVDFNQNYTLACFQTDVERSRCTTIQFRCPGMEEQRRGFAMLRYRRCQAGGNRREQYTGQNGRRPSYAVFHLFISFPSPSADPPGSFSRVPPWCGCHVRPSGCCKESPWPGHAVPV